MPFLFRSFQKMCNKNIDQEDSISVLSSATGIVMAHKGEEGRIGYDEENRLEREIMKMVSNK